MSPERFNLPSVLKILNLQAEIKKRGWFASHFKFPDIGASFDALGFATAAPARRFQLTL
jgi:hypothetical protein